MLREKRKKIVAAWVGKHGEFDDDDEGCSACAACIENILLYEGFAMEKKSFVQKKHLRIHYTWKKVALRRDKSNNKLNTVRYKDK